MDLKVEQARAKELAILIVGKYLRLRERQMFKNMVAHLILVVAHAGYLDTILIIVQCIIEFLEFTR